MNRKFDVQTLLARIRELAGAIPGLTQPRSARAREALVRRASIPPELVAAATSAAEGAPRLSRMAECDPEAVRDGMTVALDYDTIASELELLARAVRYTADLQRAELGGIALRIYKLAKNVAWNDDLVAAHVRIMSDVIRRQKRRARKRKARRG